MNVIACYYLMKIEIYPCGTNQQARSLYICNLCTNVELVIGSNIIFSK